MDEKLKRKIYNILSVIREECNVAVDGEYGHNTADGLGEAVEILSKHMKKYIPNRKDEYVK